MSPAGEQDGSLLAAVHARLRILAARQLEQERKGHTLQATALVHEAWIALRKQIADLEQEPRRFYGAAAEAMRRILIDYARRRHAQKRQGRMQRLSLDVVEVAQSASFEQVTALDEAVTALAAENPRAAEIVRLRFYAGLEEEQAAATLGISARTARREWAFARAWLWRKLQD